MTNPYMLKTPFLVLAPMDDVTDTVFRQVVAETAHPDLFYTEFVNVDGLQSPGRSKLIKKLRFTKPETPLIVQLWGKDPDNFYKTAREIADGTFIREMGLDESLKFAGLDLNMGCPDKTVVKNGTCSALINDRGLAGEIIAASREALNNSLPLSVKTRTGFNQVDLSWFEFLLNQKLNMLSIHGRTRKEMSKVPANWDVIGQVRELRDRLSPDTLIVGNGDVETRAQALELAEKYQLDGIMIGRAVFHDPFVFAKNSTWQEFTKEQRIEMFRKHVELFAKTWNENERPIHTLNKFCKIYIQGFDNAKDLREKLMAAENTNELTKLLLAYVRVPEY